MANGTVTSFNNNSTDPTIIYYGTVTDLMGDIYNVTDPGFNNSNFSIGGTATFSITTVVDAEGNFTAFGVKPGAPAPPPTTITGPYTGDITANIGDVYTVTGKEAVVTGNLIINGGTIIVEQQAQVNGTSHQISQGGVMFTRKGGNTNGNISINTGGCMKVVNNGTVRGNIGINAAGKIMIGNQNGPGFITGTLDVQGGLRAMQVSPDSKIVS